MNCPPKHIAQTHVAQALATAVGEFLSSDIFLDLVHNVADDEKRASLERLVGGVLSLWAAGGDAATGFFDQDELGKTMKLSYMQFLQVCKCLAHLLRVPAPASLGLSSREVTAITVQKAPDTFTRVIKSLLTAPEPDSVDRNVVKAASREFWCKEVSDVIRTAATDGESKVHCEKYLSELQALAEAPALLSPGCAGNLEAILSHLPKLKKAMRRGAVDSLEDALRSRVIQLGEGMLSSDSAPISSTDLSTVLNGLKSFGAENRCADLHVKLMNWATRHNSSMALGDFVTFLDGYMDSVSKQSYPEVIAVDAAHVKAVLARLTLPLPGHVLERLHVVAAHLLRRAALQAWGLASCSAEYKAFRRLFFWFARRLG